MSQIQVSNLTFTYEGSYDAVFQDVSFQIDTDWKLGLIGRNGRGKTTLLRLLLGVCPYQGTIKSSVPFEYFPMKIEDEEECPMGQLPGDVPLWKVRRELSLMEADEGLLYRPFYTLIQKISIM